MDYRRIIPVLDVQHGHLVKGVHFEHLKDLGDPAETAAAYSEAGADELMFLDIGATVEHKHLIIDVVKRTIEKISVPLSVGGGIKNNEDIRTLLDVGASRIVIGTAAFKNPEFVKQASSEFSSDKVIVSIDTFNSFDTESGFEVVIVGGKEPTGTDAVEWAKKAEELGAGTIMTTSVDADGTQTGYDIPATQAIADAISIPVMASGGAGSLDDLNDVITEGHADAVVVGSIVHFGKYTIKQMKEYLFEKGIPVRL
jgi:cyclase